MDFKVMLELPEGFPIEEFRSFWDKTPEKVRSVISDYIKKIVTADPNTPELRGKRAVLLGDVLILPKDSGLEEIWHEVGHIIVDNLLGEEDKHLVDELYDFEKDPRPPGDVLAEDFYFMLKGKKESPFWRRWLDNPKEDSMDNGIELQKVAQIFPLDIVEAVLDELAKLVYDSGEESYTLMWRAAKEALKDAKKEDQLSYENRDAPHQYYYPEDEEGAKDVVQHPREPLSVERMDVSPRGGNRDVGFGMV